MKPLYGQITRNDVRVAARGVRQTYDTCGQCLLAVVLARLTGIAHRVGHSKAWSMIPHKSPDRILTDEGRQLIRMFDSGYAGNIDKLYRRIKAQYPDKVQLTIN